jgi:phosphatidylglycerol lysyltransferase
MGSPDTIRRLTVPHTHRKVPWATLLGLALFGVAMFWLHHLIALYHWRDILGHMRSIQTSQLLGAVVLTAAGYGCLTLYDALGLRFAGASVPYPRLALISFMGYAIGHNVGFNTLSGGAIRLRAYSVLGLSTKQIATVVAFGSLTFCIGAAALLGLSLLSQAPLSGTVLHLHRSIIVIAGCALLAGVGAYLWLACTRHEPLRLRKLTVPVPTPGIAFAQIGVASGDLLCAAGVLYSLLPPEMNVGFGSFAAIFIIAIAAGIISNVPGGVGVFESVLLLLFRQVPPDQLLGALLAYRIIYYLVPFAVALCLLGAHELWVHRGPVVRLVQLGRTWLGTVTPQASAVAVFGAGAVLLLSGSTPGLGDRLELLRRFVPLSILELSHLLGSAVGVGLLILAHGLYRRLDAAWYLTIWTLCAGVLLSLLKGFDYEEAIVLGAVAVVLISARTRFRRRASLIEQRFSVSWVIAVVLVLGAAVWLV